MIAWSAALLLAAAAPPAELDAYLAQRDELTPPRIERRGAETWIEFQSQVWEGRPWTHALVVVRPAADRSLARGADAAILEITGGRPNPTDLARARRAADESGLAVATLFDIPNQPIDGRFEDDLIAHTFEGFLRDGRPEQLLPFAMAKAAVRAMDRLEPLGYRRFIPTGASKRGWTTWLVAGSGDRRVVALMPRVIDVLDMPAQLAHQRASWGRTSPMIADYTDRDLPSALGTDAGRRLVSLVDPFSYRARVTVPNLIVVGTNDAYWTVDAHRLYLDRLPGPTWMRVVPNQGHGIGDAALAEARLAGFARAVAAGDRLPRPRFEPFLRDGRAGFRIRPDGPVRRVRLWSAFRPDRDFTRAEWRSVDGPAAPGPAAPGPEELARGGWLTVDAPRGDARVAAWFAEVEYALPSGPVAVTSPVEVDGPLANPPR